MREYLLFIRIGLTSRLLFYLCKSLIYSVNVSSDCRHSFRKGTAYTDCNAIDSNEAKGYVKSKIIKATNRN